MSNYITTSKFFSTGFLRPDASALRAKQGLPSQNIVNDCAWNKTDTASGLAGDPVVLYPAGVTALPNYGMKPMRPGCPCAQWVQPP